jgi:hypothetical protein
VGKPLKDKITPVRLTDEMRTSLKKLAAQQGHNLSGYIRWVLETHTSQLKHRVEAPPSAVTWGKVVKRITGPRKGAHRSKSYRRKK